VIIKLDFPASCLFPNAKAKKGWHAAIKAKVAAREAAFYTTKQTAGAWKPEPGLIPLSIVFCPPDKVRRDWDGMAGAIKSALDGVAMALGVDDSRFRPILIDVGEVGKPGAVVLGIGVSIVSDSLKVKA
jgi:crossover junction endodeoxyribonuclease RusA